MTSELLSDRIIASLNLNSRERHDLLDLEYEFSKGFMDGKAFMISANMLLPPTKWQDFMLTIASSELRNLFRQTNQHKIMLEEAVAPRGFSTDTMPLLQLPYRCLGRLAVTCRWMRRTITEKMIREAFARVKKSMGLYTVIEEGMKTFQFMSSDEDVIELKHIGDNLFRIKLNGVAYVSNANHHATARSNAKAQAMREGGALTDVMLCDLLMRFPSDARIGAVIGDRKPNFFEAELTIVNNACQNGPPASRPKDLEFTVAVKCLRF